jgi:hypothetical protein
MTERANLIAFKAKICHTGFSGTGHRVKAKQLSAQNPPLKPPLKLPQKRNVSQIYHNPSAIALRHENSARSIARQFEHTTNLVLPTIQPIT